MGKCWEQSLEFVKELPTHDTTGSSEEAVSLSTYEETRS